MFWSPSICVENYISQFPLRFGKMMHSFCSDSLVQCQRGDRRPTQGQSGHTHTHTYTNTRTHTQQQQEEQNQHGQNSRRIHECQLITKSCAINLLWGYGSTLITVLIHSDWSVFSCYAVEFYVHFSINKRSNVSPSWITTCWRHGIELLLRCIANLIKLKKKIGSEC